MSKENWAKDYIENTGNGQWKYVMRHTLLTLKIQVQCFLLGGQQSRLGEDFIVEIFFIILVVCFLPLRFKFFDIDPPCSDLPLQLLDLIRRSHSLPIFTDLPKVLSLGTSNLVPQMRKECSKNNAFSRYPSQM